MLLRRAALAALVLALCLPLRPAAQGTVFFLEDFNTFNDCNYSTGWHWPFDNKWTCDHLATGDVDGSGAAHIVQKAGQEQYNFGWNTPPMGGTWPVGSSFFVGYRIRWDDTARVPFANSPNADRGGKNKAFILGAGGGGPESRIIIYTETVTDGGSGCMLDAVDYVDGLDPNDSGNSTIYPWARPSHWGLTTPNNRFYNSALYRSYWPMYAMRGVSGEDYCDRPVLMSYGSNTAAPAPGPGSARPVNGWYVVIVKVTSGTSGRLTTWANKCDEAAPTSTTMVRDIGTAGWGNYSNNIGAYSDSAPGSDLGFRLGSFILSSSFPQAWCTQGLGTTPPPPTSPAPLIPTAVRVS